MGETKFSLDALKEAQYNIICLMSLSKDINKIVTFIGIYNSLENLKKFAS